MNNKIKIPKKEIVRLVREYETVVKVLDKKATKQSDRSYGGFIRATKGHLVEYLTEEIIKLSWKILGGKEEDLEINSVKIKIPIRQEYLNSIKDEEIKNFIKKNLDDYFYKLSVDKQIFVKGKFVIGIECKAYTENAMLKRILVDFKLLKSLYPNLKCFLFQLESQLGGDYSELKEKTFGSPATHTLLSYFPEVDLKIFTFLKGERKVDQPIHKFFKPLEYDRLKKAILLLSNELKQFV